MNCIHAKSSPKLKVIEMVASTSDFIECYIYHIHNIYTYIYMDTVWYKYAHKKSKNHSSLWQKKAWKFLLNWHVDFWMSAALKFSPGMILYTYTFLDSINSCPCQVQWWKWLFCQAHQDRGMPAWRTRTQNVLMQLSTKQRTA